MPEVLNIIIMIACAAVIVQILSVPTHHFLQVLFEPRRMSHRRANLHYYKFWRWFRHHRTIEQVADWLVLFPVWGYIFYIIGQAGRWVFEKF